MINSFETAIAEKHGMSAAVVHQEILRWCTYNEKEETAEVFVDGKYWMYTSHARLQKHLSYMSVSTVRRALTCLNDAGLLESRTRASHNPNALLYRALTHEHTYAQNEHTPYGQNEHTPYAQNGHSEHKELEHRQLNKKEDVGARAHQKAKTKPTPAEIIAAFYQAIGTARPPDNTAPWDKDMKHCEKILAEGYTGKQILGIPDLLPDSDISSFRYVSIKILRRFYEKKEVSLTEIVDDLTDTNKKIDVWADTVPATDEEVQAAIAACKETLQAARGEAPPANTSRIKRIKPKAEPVPEPESVAITDDDLPF